LNVYILQCIAATDLRGCSTSNRLGVSRGPNSQKFGTVGPTPLGWGRGWPRQTRSYIT